MLPCCCHGTQQELDRKMQVFSDLAALHAWLAIIAGRQLIKAEVEMIEA